MSTLLIFIVITVLVLTGILFVIVSKENTPTNKKPNSLFPVEDFPSFEDAPVAEEKPFTEHTQSAKKKKYYYSNKTKSTKKPKQVKANQ
jgi:flagellar basal body-associated protein FliL